jgi:GTPase SAR1 family protein
VTRKASFENVPRWLRELRDHANRDIVLMLVGNKADLSIPETPTASTPAAAATASGADAANTTAPTPTSAGTDATAVGVRQVSEEEARKMAAEYGIAYVETSAKTGTNVDAAFVQVVSKIYETSFKGVKPQGMSSYSLL